MLSRETVNANKTSHTTGITAFTSSDETRQKWIVTQKARSSISQPFDKAGLEKTEDSSQELNNGFNHRIKHDNEELRKMTGHIE